MIKIKLIKGIINISSFLQTFLINYLEFRQGEPRELQEKGYDSFTLAPEKPEKVPKPFQKEDVIKALKKIKYKLKPMDIVLIYTGADKMLGTSDYVNKYVGMSPDAVEYIIDQGVKMLGIDTIGLDRPCFDMFKEFLETKDKSKIWPSHFLGRRREFAHMERIGNLGAIPKPFGFTVSCLPVKVKNAGAGWARVVAII